VKNRIISLILVIALSLTLFLGVNASDSGEGLLENDELLLDGEQNEVEYEFVDDERREEKIYCTATLDEDYVDNVVVVVIDKYVGSINKEYTIDFFDGNEDIASIEDLTRVTGDPHKLGIDVENYHQILKVTLKTHSKENVLNVIKEFEKIDGIKSASPDCILENPIVDLGTDTINQTVFGYGVNNLIITDEVIPDDQYYSYQWGLKAINASHAWYYTRGSQSLKVGVLDTGVDDVSGFGDNLVSGWDYYSTNSAIIPGTDSYLGDYYGHGTQVAGIIGAQGDDTSGVTGVCWDVSIVPLRTSGTETNMIRALNYALNNGIPIVNYSMGGGNSDDDVEAEINNYPGLLVCSAGNNASDNDVISHYPSDYECDNIISVAAAHVNSSTGAIELVPPGVWVPGSSQGSNYGDGTVDIAAPGDVIHTIADGGGIDYDFEGTSAAAPFVTGTAALILSICPDMSTEQLKEIILETASTESALIGKVANGAFLDAGAAVSYAASLTKKVTYVVGEGDEAYTTTYYLAPGSSFAIDNYPSCEGYKFIGWKCGDTIYDIGDTINNVQSDIVLEAELEPIYYVMSYDAPLTGLTGMDELEHIADLDGADTISYSFLRRTDWSGNYYLWKWKENGVEKVIDPYSDGYLDSLRSYQFTEAAHKHAIGQVTFDANGGENAPEPQTVYSGSGTVLTTAEPTRDGYTFLGWSSTSSTGEFLCFPGDRYLVASQSTLYAVWVEDIFVIRFDPGTDVTDSVQASSPSSSLTCGNNSFELTLPAALEREGNVFGGWSYTTPTGTTMVYQPGETVILSDEMIGALDSNGGNIIRFTAVWQEPRAEFAIAFVDLPQYGGMTGDKWIRMVDIASDSENVTYGGCYLPGGAYDENESAFPTNPEKDGYIFEGWADADGNVITADTVVEKDGFHVIYARWIPEEEFTDVTDEALSYDVALSTWYGYMQGADDGEFDPDGSMTRADAAMALYNVDGAPIYGNNVFYDVNTYNGDGSLNLTSQAVSWATQNGIIHPVSNTAFDLDGNVTREEFINSLFIYVSIYRGAALNGSHYNLNTVKLYSDYTDIVIPKLRYAWALAEGIITVPISDTLAPGMVLTRGEATQMVARFREYLLDIGMITTYKDGPDNPSGDTIGYLEPILGDNSWAQINAASEAGVADIIWNVGDTKDVTLSTGEIITLQIYGFNHDDITGGVKAGITFGLLKVMNGVKSMNNSNNNIGGYTETALYDWLTTDLYNSLPTELRAYMKNVDKKTSVGGGSAEIETDSMNVFLFSEYECCGWLHYSAAGEGQQYEIFVGQQGIQARQKHNPDLGINEWWLRSPSVSGTTNFGIIHSTGSAGYTSASWPYAGVNFGLCI